MKTTLFLASDIPPATSLSGKPLPEDHYLTGEFGIRAEFYADGALKSYLSFRRKNDPANSWALHLVKDKEEGLAQLKNGSGGSPDYDEYKNGHSNFHDAWSDASPKKSVIWKQWVKDWIKSINDEY